LTNSWFNCVRTWTNKNLKEKGIKEVNEMKFRAYLGLEMAMSILQINDISYYWRKVMFTGHEDFKKTMSRDNFQHPSSYSHAEASADPLWHSQKLLEHFQKNICQIAVPIGTSALDEVCVRTKARTTASLYLPSKPDKYAIRLYAVVGSTNTYVSSRVDKSQISFRSNVNDEGYSKRFLVFGLYV
jgi:Transposase IS4